MTKVKYLLRDRSEEIAAAWSKYFTGIPEVEVSAGDIFALRADAIISPANSFGFMDGGIDLVYSHRFGWQLQEDLQDVLRSEHDGELPVGQAVIIETHDTAIPYLISAPTMRIPMAVNHTVNAYLAFRAALRAVREHNRHKPGSIQSVLCPGLGTLTGIVPPEVCAKQMFAAYAICEMGQLNSPRTLRDAAAEHYRLAD